MPQAKKPAARPSRPPAAFREPAALKRLSRSLDTAQDALAELRKDTGRDVGQAARDLYKNLRTFLSTASRDTGKLATALQRDFAQAQKRLGNPGPSSRHASAPSRARGARSEPAARRPQRTRTPARAGAGAGATASTRSAAAGPSPTRPARAATGAAKGAILEALAGGQAMTAAELATATDLGRGTVSTTLSRLARAGDITKADRGYQIAHEPVTVSETIAEPSRAEPATVASADAGPGESDS
jgi:DNA-binding transcriptional ArsR family regulator